MLEFNIGKKVNCIERVNELPLYKNTKDRMQKADLFADEVSLVKREITEAFKSEENPFFNDINQRANKLAIKKWQEENIIKGSNKLTISTTTIKNSYNGNNSTFFNYTFKIAAASEMQVIIRSSVGTETIKTLIIITQFLYWKFWRWSCNFHIWKYSSF